MSSYHFGRFGTFWREPSGVAIYAGGRRISKEPNLVWWWPVNWLAVAIVAPVVLPVFAFKRFFGSRGEKKR